MRIVAGKYRGRPIQPPVGNATRPTIDRVREALFSSLYSLRGGFEDAVVLDPFAGSGALGLEALSRGAKQVVFYEIDRKALDALEYNRKALQVLSSSQVVKDDVLKRPPTNAAMTFDLVLLDPPYKTPAQEVLSLLKEMRSSGTLSPDALITYEHSGDTLDEVMNEAAQAGFEVISQKKYGKTRISILKEAR